ncbi:hypothetical protein SAMN05428964_1011347 [Thalassospira xiamenensis]|uniref:Uncharacterized protein n=1 Tax=Thalassospira xiamenensis TaxID=220697 RepID=A0A285RMV9_9PROT|nr:hypothetical protein SAMN05428964_1011347 [Thalassospira xiamenensis]
MDSRFRGSDGMGDIARLKLRLNLRHSRAGGNPDLRAASSKPSAAAPAPKQKRPANRKACGSVKEVTRRNSKGAMSSEFRVRGSGLRFRSHRHHPGHNRPAGIPTQAARCALECAFKAVAQRSCRATGSGMGPVQFHFQFLPGLARCHKAACPVGRGKQDGPGFAIGGF